MPKVFVRKRRVGWAYAFEVYDEAHRGWRPSRRWASHAARRRVADEMKTAAPRSVWPSETARIDYQPHHLDDLFDAR
jgi:hypothetical protein